MASLCKRGPRAARSGSSRPRPVAWHGRESGGDLVWRPIARRPAPCYTAKTGTRHWSSIILITYITRREEDAVLHGAANLRSGAAFISSLIELLLTACTPVDPPHIHMECHSFISAVCDHRDLHVQRMCSGRWIHSLAKVCATVVSRHLTSNQGIFKLSLIMRSSLSRVCSVFVHRISKPSGERIGKCEGTPRNHTLACRCARCWAPNDLFIGNIGKRAHLRRTASGDRSATAIHGAFTVQVKLKAMHETGLGANQLYATTPR